MDARQRRQFFLAFLIWIVLVAASPAGVGHAAPLIPRQGCPPNVVMQQDMAGLYESGSMSFLVHACGASSLIWQNAYGQHSAIYVTEKLLPGGGYIAWGYQPDPELQAYMDSSVLLAFKPAEPGYIQLATFTRDGNQIVSVYTLRKVG